LPQPPELRALRASDPTTVVAGQQPGSVRGPINRPEVLLQRLSADQEVHELAIERRESVEAREPLHDAAKGRIDRFPRDAHAGDREVPSLRDAIRALRGGLRGPTEGLVQEVLCIEDGREIEHRPRELAARDKDVVLTD